MVRSEWRSAGSLCIQGLTCQCFQSIIGATEKRRESGAGCKSMGDLSQRGEWGAVYQGCIRNVARSRASSPSGRSLNPPCRALKFHHRFCPVGLRSAQARTAEPPAPREPKMTSNLVKVVLIAGALLLSACSSSSAVNSDPCFSGGCQAFGDHSPNKAAKMNFGGSGLGSSYGEYRAGLLHDD